MISGGVLFSTTCLKIHSKHVVSFCKVVFFLERLNLFPLKNIADELIHTTIIDVKCSIIFSLQYI